MDLTELGHLLTDGAHWAFEIITDLVITVATLAYTALVPDRWNPFKRWLHRHDATHHAPRPYMAPSVKPADCDHDPRWTYCSRCCPCPDCGAIRAADGDLEVLAR